MLSGVKLKIIGRVQGVFYRQSTKSQAQVLGLRGWVRNLADGSVEALAVGPKDKLELLIDWCGRGPNNARVERVDVKWLDGDGGTCADELKFSDLAEKFEVR